MANGSSLALQDSFSLAAKCDKTNASPIRGISTALYPVCLCLSPTSQVFYVRCRYTVDGGQDLKGSNRLFPTSTIEFTSSQVIWQQLLPSCIASLQFRRGLHCPLRSHTGCKEMIVRKRAVSAWHIDKSGSRNLLCPLFQRDTSNTEKVFITWKSLRSCELTWKLFLQSGHLECLPSPPVTIFTKSFKRNYLWDYIFPPNQTAGWRISTANQPKEH